jgi:hypothetical protein
MSDPKKRVVAAILGLALTFTLAACGSDDDPSDTTIPGGTDTTTTTESVGS